MKKGYKRRKLKKPVKVKILLFFIVLILFLTGGFILDRMGKFKFSKELDTVAVQVSNQRITLSELCYYIYLVEEDVQKKANIYNSDNPLEYWNLHFSAGMESTFMRNLAKDAAYDTCISDLIYVMMAKDENYELTEEEKLQAKEDASIFFEQLTDQQLQRTMLTIEKLNHIFEQRALAKKYAIHYAVDYSKTIQANNSSGNITKEQVLKELSVGGSHYENVLKNKYPIDMNSFLYDNLPIGNITVN